MNRRTFLRAMGMTGGWIGLGTMGAGAARKQPNVVIIFTDDQGYADIGCFGAAGFKTPNLDQMAKEGRKFTDFYVASSVCSPSRASLLTGCYHLRTGVNGVLFPERGDHPGPGKKGLHPDEVTIADVLKTAGYATAAVGKWHLGDAKPFLPPNQGFDEYFGIPYSNDMWNGPDQFGVTKKGFPPLPLIDGTEIVETNPDQRYLTKRYTERAVAFIEKNRAKPFFLYLAHSMPHVPLYVSEDFEGNAAYGIYGDVIEEIDWSVGEVLKTIKAQGLDRNTLVIFTADNGPWLSKKEHAGKADPLRDGKFSKYEGGHRVPCIMRWPGKVPAGTETDGMAGTIDLLPTIAGLAGAEAPADRNIDGMDIWPLIGSKRKRSPRDTFFYSTKVVRHQQWKLFLPGSYRDTVPPPGGGSKGTGKFDHPRLFNLKQDIGETTDVHEQHPEVVEKLTKLLEAFQADIDVNVRPIGKVDEL